MIRRNVVSSAVLLTVFLLTGAAAGCRAGGEENKTADIGRLGVYQDWTDSGFYTQAGRKAEIPVGEKPVILVYWASWCPHCREGLQTGLEQLQQTAEEAGADLYLVNKLDGEKETVETAEAYLQDEQLSLPVVYDQEAAVYEDRGLTVIPTVIALDREGRVSSYTEGRVPGRQELASMAREATAGKAAYLAAAVEKNLLDGSGGLRTNYLEGDGTLPSGGDILSESQGLMLQYAASAKDRELFDAIWNRLQAGRLPAEGKLAFPWVMTQKQEIHTNAAVDDLRIYRALHTAQEQWGGLQKELGELQAALGEYLVQDGGLVDFYDFKMGQKAGTLSLCYADLKAMELLAQAEESWNGVADAGRRLIENGRISEPFPLYHSRYDYRTREYAQDTLNMSEELLLLLHLAETDSLPEETWSWLLAQLQSGVIYAGYGMDGRPPLDKRYESTAVYGLAAMIALEMEDRDSASYALSLMEAFRIRDGENGLDGLFGGKDGDGIYSFDQCIALRAYQKMDGLP